jgi:hypothetical protein
MGIVEMGKRKDEVVRKKRETRREGSRDRGRKGKSAVPKRGS